MGYGLPEPIGRMTRDRFPRRHPHRPEAARTAGLPLTKERLEYDSARQELISRSAKLAYPIRDGIPIMLPEEARALVD